MSTLHHSAPPWNWGLQRTSCWKITVKIRIHWVSSTFHCSLRGYIKIWKFGRRGHLNDFVEEILLIEDLIYWSSLLYSLVQNNRSAHVIPEFSRWWVVVHVDHGQLLLVVPETRVWCLDEMLRVWTVVISVDPSWASSSSVAGTPRWCYVTVWRVLDLILRR